MKKYIILLIILSSCGSRQSEVHKQETEKKTETALDIKSDIQETVKTETEIKASAVTWSIVPVDPDKPATVTAPDGKTYKINNAKLEVKKERQTANVKTEAGKKDNSVVRVKHKSDEKSSTVDKKKQRDAVMFPWWGWIIIAAILYAVYRFIKSKCSFFS